MIPTPSGAPGRFDERSPDVRESQSATASQAEFLLRLADQMRPLGEPLAVQRTACRALGDHLGASRVGYAEDTGDDETVVVTHNYTNGVPSIEGRYRYDDFGRELLPAFRAGRTVVRPDIARHPTLSARERDAHATLQLGATVNVPLVKSGHLVAVFFVHGARARQWRLDEIRLIESVAERTWDAVRRTRAETLLLQREAELETIITLTPFLMTRCGRDLTYKFVSRSYAEFLGMATDEVVGRRIVDVLGNEAFSTIKPFIDRALAGEVVQYESSIPFGHGTRDLSVVYTPERNGLGEVVGWVASILEVSERRRFEREIQRLNQELQNRVTQFETLLQILPVGVWQADPDCRRIIGNAAADEMLGVARGTNASLTTPLDPLHARAFANGRELTGDELPMQLAGRTGTPVRNFEHDVVFEDGRRITLMANVAPLLDASHRVQGIVGVYVDMTERKRAEERLRQSEEQLREDDRRKDEFLAVLAHELRNPLAPLRTALELIRLSSNKTEALERVRPLMERQIGHMVRLIDDLLDVSRIRSGRIQLQRKPVELADLVKASTEGSRALLEDAGIQLVVSVPSSPCVLDVDPTRIVQVISNLLHNAAKFTPRGGVVSLTVGVTMTAFGPEAVLSVRDSGIGISAEKLPQVFDLFVQGEPAGYGKGGLGIGLALARRLIEMHGGTIAARSDGPGTGSTFSIRLPVTTLALLTEEPLTSTPLRIDRRVLVIDDNEDAADMLEQLVSTLGGTAASAYSGAAGLQLAREFEPDVVLIDIGMPGMDGYETCRRLRDELGASALLVALTGWGQDQDKRKALESGFDAHLTKPADPRALETLLGGPDAAGA